jgi:mono/diheme cytochrome c family protein
LNCHDSDGRGGLGREQFPKIPDFTSATWQSSHSDARLEEAILQGRGKTMPALKGELGDDEVAKLITLVRSFQDGQLLIPGDAYATRVEQEPPAPNAVALSLSGSPPSRDVQRAATPESRALYAQSCRKCHGEDGRGNVSRPSTPGIPDFTSPGWQASRNQAQLTASILDGKGRDMPAFGRSLSDEQVRSLVCLIRAFGPATAPASVHPAGDFDSRFSKLCRELEALEQEYRAIPTSQSSSSSHIHMKDAQSSAPVVR